MTKLILRWVSLAVAFWVAAYFMSANVVIKGDWLTYAGIAMDLAAHRVIRNGRFLHLGPTEFRLLHFFMTHPERVHSRSQLLDKVWGDHVFVEERTVDVHIRRLRSILEASGHDALVQTVRGSGYRFSTTAT